MSSTGVYGFTNGKVNEKSKINPENEYEKSKAEGEKIVLESGLDACIVRGAIILGANNYWKKMFEMLKKKLPLPCSGTNKFQIIYSKELARAIVLVLKKGKKGEIYLAAGNEKPTLNEFCEMAQEELKLEKRVKHIPAKVAILAGKIFGIKVLTNENIRHLSKERDYDTRKIQKLGWKEKKKIRQALRETIKELK
jgi:NADH dehydrogenase